MSSLSSFKIAAFRKAELALAKQVAEFEALKSDPELRKELEFNAVLDKFLESHGMTRGRLQAFLMAQGTASDVPKAPTKVYNTQPARMYKNPSTGETLTVKRVDNKKLREWISEHGEDVVSSWQIT